MKETKRTYEEPQVEVVELMEKNQLLAGSNGTGSFDGNPEEEDMN